MANPSSIVFLSGADVTGPLNNAMSFIVSQLTMIFLPLLALLLSRNVTAQVTSVPPAIPLAVRSPYLSCWLQSGNATAAFGQTWPTTFNHSQVCHPDYFTGREILILKFSVSDPRVVCPRTCRWSHIFAPGGCTPEPLQWYRQLYKHCDHSYADRGQRASWAHASQSHLSKPYRGSFFTLLLLSMFTYASP